MGECRSNGGLFDLLRGGSRTFPSIFAAFGKRPLDTGRRRSRGHLYCAAF